MKNLQKIGVQELGIQEIREIEAGGFVDEIVRAFKELDDNWDELKRRFREGYDSYECA